MIARDDAAAPADRARMWLDVSAIRQDRLGDARGALDAAAGRPAGVPGPPRGQAPGGGPRHPGPGLHRAPALAGAADALRGQAAEERSLRMRAAQLAEEELE